MQKKIANVQKEKNKQWTSGVVQVENMGSVSKWPSSNKGTIFRHIAARVNRIEFLEFPL